MDWFGWRTLLVRPLKEQLYLEPRLIREQEIPKQHGKYTCIYILSLCILPKINQWALLSLIIGDFGERFQAAVESIHQIWVIIRHILCWPFHSLKVYSCAKWSQSFDIRFWYQIAINLLFVSRLWPSSNLFYRWDISMNYWWCIHNARDRDWEQDQKWDHNQWFLILLCRNVQTGPRQGQGPEPLSLVVPVLFSVPPSAPVRYSFISCII